MNASTSFDRAHLAELERLAERSKNDPVLGPQDRARLENFQSRQAAGDEERGIVPATRVALFLSGEAVRGAAGIDAGLAAQALAQYSKMFREQATIAEREAVEGQRRPKGSVKPELLFTGTPRGSFGFAFAPGTTDSKLVGFHNDAIDSLTKIIADVAADPQQTADKKIPSAILPHLKLFFQALSSRGVSLRLAGANGFRKTFAVEQIKATAEQLDREVESETIALLGTFRGLTLDTRQFDVLTEDEEQISGTVDSELPLAELKRISGFLDQTCTFTFEKTIIKHIGHRPVTEYLLLHAAPVEAAEAA